MDQCQCSCDLGWRCTCLYLMARIVSALAIIDRFAISEHAWDIARLGESNTLEWRGTLDIWLWQELLFCERPDADCYFHSTLFATLPKSLARTIRLWASATTSYSTPPKRSTIPSTSQTVPLSMVQMEANTRSTSRRTPPPYSRSFTLCLAPSV